MNTINVHKEDLAEHLVKNKEKHEKRYNEAMEGYRAEAIRVLSQAVENAKAGKEITIDFDLYEPVSHLDDYERVLGMLELHSGAIIEITALQYDNYVRDKWIWSHVFSSSTSSYCSSSSEEVT